MSHRLWSALFFALTSFAIVSVIGAQQPPSADDPARAQPAQPQPQAKQTPTAESTSTSDQPSAPSPEPAASSSQSLTTVHVYGGPSADILRSARNAGFKIKIANGTTHFCKSGAPVGTRFVSESCMNEQQVTLWLSRAQDQRDTLTHLLGAPASTH